MKSLASHIKHITEVQNIDYYDLLTDEEKANFDKSTFFIWEKLGLCMDLIPILDKYKSVLRGEKGKRLYTVLIEIIPKGKYQFKQIRKCKGKKYNKSFIELLIKEYNCSVKEAKEYIDIYTELRLEEIELQNLMKKYGIK